MWRGVRCVAFLYAVCAVCGGRCLPFFFAGRCLYLFFRWRCAVLCSGVYTFFRLSLRCSLSVVGGVVCCWLVVFSICVSLGGVPLTSFSLCVSLWRWCIVMYRFMYRLCGFLFPSLFSSLSRLSYLFSMTIKNGI